MGDFNQFYEINIIETKIFLEFLGIEKIQDEDKLKSFLKEIFWEGSSSISSLKKEKFEITSENLDEDGEIFKKIYKCIFGNQYKNDQLYTDNKEKIQEKFLQLFLELVENGKIEKGSVYKEIIQNKITSLEPPYYFVMFDDCDKDKKCCFLCFKNYEGRQFFCDGNNKIVYEHVENCCFKDKFYEHALILKGENNKFTVTGIRNVKPMNTNDEEAKTIKEFFEKIRIADKKIVDKVNEYLKPETTEAIQKLKQTKKSTTSEPTQTGKVYDIPTPQQTSTQPQPTRPTLQLRSTQIQSGILSSAQQKPQQEECKLENDIKRIKEENKPTYLKEITEFDDFSIEEQSFTIDDAKIIGSFFEQPTVYFKEDKDNERRIIVQAFEDFEDKYKKIEEEKGEERIKSLFEKISKLDKMQRKELLTKVLIARGFKSEQNKKTKKEELKNIREYKTTFGCISNKLRSKAKELTRDQSGNQLE